MLSCSVELIKKLRFICCYCTEHQQSLYSAHPAHPHPETVFLCYTDNDHSGRGGGSTPHYPYLYQQQLHQQQQRQQYRTHHPDEAAAAAGSRPAAHYRSGHAPASEHHHARWRSAHEGDGEGAAGTRGSGERKYTSPGCPSGGYGYEYHPSQDGVYGGRPFAREPDVQPSMAGWKPLGASAGGYGYGGGGGGGGWGGRGGGGGLSGPGGGRGERARSTDNLELLAKAASKEDSDGRRTT